jgi:hypothetical protein
MPTYSFKNIQCSLVGPGGSIQLGQGAGAAEEGISVAMDEDKTTTVTGADGSIMHSLHAGQTGTMTMRLLKTSPNNAQVSQFYALQQATSALWGQNQIGIVDTARGDVIAGAQMAFVKFSDLGYGKDANFNEWVFRGLIQQVLGTGTPAA